MQIVSEEVKSVQNLRKGTNLNFHLSFFIINRDGKPYLLRRKNIVESILFRKEILRYMSSSRFQ